MSTESRNATIIVAVDSFGLRVIHRFLLYGSLQAREKWTDEGVRSDNLHFINLEVVVSNENESTKDLVEMENLQSLRDLFQRVENCSPDDFPSRLDSVTRDLMTVNVSEKAPDGVDIFVIGEPTSAFHHIDQLLKEAANHISNSTNTGLQSTLPAARLFKIFSVSDLWSSENRSIRTAIRKSEQFWEGKDLPVRLQRTFLLENRIGAGRLSRESSVDQITVFLELVVFDELTNSSVNELMTRRDASESSLGTFRIRVIENSVPALCRVAGAEDGIRWLNQISRKENDADPARLRTSAALLTLEDLVERLSFQAEGSVLEQLTSELESGISGLLESGEYRRGWSTRIMVFLQELQKGLDKVLHESTQRGVSDFDRGNFRIQRQNLLDAIVEDLQKDELTSVQEIRRAVDASMSRLMVKREEWLKELDVGDPNHHLRIDQAESKYQKYVKNRMLATPFTIGLWVAALIPAYITILPYTSSFLAALGTTFPGIAQYQQFNWFEQNPLVAWSSMGLLFLITVTLLSYRNLRGHEHQANQYFVHKKLGLLYARPYDIGSEIIDDSQKKLARVRAHAAASCLRLLKEVHDTLGDRLFEMDWLNRQVTDYVTRFKKSGADSLDVIDPYESSVRQWAHNDEDIERIYRFVGRGKGNIRRPYADNEGFDWWFKRNTREFLFPMAFIDAMSQPFLESASRPDPNSGTQVTPGTVDETQFESFIQQTDLSVNEGLLRGLDIQPEPLKFAFIPASSTNTIVRRLDANGFIGTRVKQISNSGRAYLLNIVVRASGSHLERI